MSFPSPPTFEDKHKERAYLKGRLAAAFRIFGKYGYDEGVAGHITMRVCCNVERAARGELLLMSDNRTRLIPRLSG
jgi:ribulose-5-phosphate 4-epimerase/fuculose-1-phosphate aldolase